MPYADRFKLVVIFEDMKSNGPQIFWNAKHANAISGDFPKSQTRK